MDLQELNNLVDDPGNVPLPIRIGAIVFLFIVVMSLGYKLIIIDQYNELEQVELKEVELKKTFETKQEKASQLPAYVKQLEEMRFSFGTLVRQLPGKTEIPGLILDISEKSISNGLQVELFKPNDEVHKEFYAEKPIIIKARGNYNQLASFVSDISGLSRIVTIHDIQLVPEKDGKLTMAATINTYRYLNENEGE
jgi:type IV pilus assembly protein PilO